MFIVLDTLNKIQKMELVEKNGVISREREREERERERRERGVFPAHLHL